MKKSLYKINLINLVVLIALKIGDFSMSKFKLGSTYQIFTVSSDFMKKDSGHNKLDDLCKKHSIPISVKYEKRPIPAPYLGKGEKIFLTQLFTTPKKLEHSIDLICSDFEIKHIPPKGTEILLFLSVFPLQGVP